MPNTTVILEAAAAVNEHMGAYLSRMQSLKSVLELYHWHTIQQFKWDEQNHCSDTDFTDNSRRSKTHERCRALWSDLQRN